MSCGRICGTRTALLHRHAYAQRAIDRADRLALPAPDCRMAAQEAADAAAHSATSPVLKAPISTNSTPSVASARPRTVLRTHELRQEGQEEQRRLGVQHLGQDRLPECRARVDARPAPGREVGRSRKTRTPR